MTDRIPAPTRAMHVRSAVFALVFAPVALSMMNASMADVIAVTAVGQPLSSIGGMAGMILSCLLIGFVTANSEDSDAGMIVTTGVSFFLALLQLGGISPGATLLGLTQEEVSVAMSWSMYPLVSSVILLAATLAMMNLRRTAHNASFRETDDIVMFFGEGKQHYRDRSIALGASLASVLVATALFIYMAPTDSSGVAAFGLTGMTLGHEPRYIAGIFAALALGLAAYSSQHSVLGPQLVIWFVLVLPSFFIIPLWASLTGNVVTPGESPLTAVQVALPALTASGLLLGAVSLGCLWTRRYLQRQLTILTYTPTYRAPATEPDVETEEAEVVSE